MKSKFVLTEEESKRILSLHKEKIQEEREVVSEEINESEEILVESSNDDAKINYKNATVTLKKKLPLIKTVYGTNKYDYNVERAIIGGAVFKGSKKGNLVADVMFEDPQTGKRTKRTAYYYCWPNKLRKSENTVPKIQVGDLFYAPGGSLTDGMSRDLKNFDKLCERLKYQNKQETPPPPVPSKQGCPKIVKSFTDAGFTQITVERYRELANDTTRVRKYKFCPVTKKNLYFAKPKQGTGGGGGGGGTGGGDNSGGGGGGGTRYSFDYNQILTAINQKCPGGGGGGTPEDVDIVNPFGQGAEEGQPQPQVIKVTDKIYSIL
jgi:uncharacterized membrane protein YgcG